MSMCIASYLNFETTNVEIGEHAILKATCIVEGKLELKGILVSPRSKSPNSIRSVLIEDSRGWEEIEDFV